ncbi:MAG: 3-dehydroquinate synthase [Sedimentisphaerales bacterium]|jgi:3-dehydroquinate synthase|nr:3-dehydroquinate synthase [Sedimentisphaerales bacterium]
MLLVIWPAFPYPDAMLYLDVNVPATPARSYRITVGSGLLQGVLDQVAQILPRRPFLVTDTNLMRAGLVDRLLGDRTIPMFVIDPPGESSKNLHTLGQILDAMEEAGLGRDSVLVALGGGTVGDIGGFAASVFKRGIPVVQIPTTTLAQADSAIGGKTGVDSGISKNAFGTFWHPAAVFMDVDCLRTLDQRYYRAGLVESVKHAMIADPGLFAYLEDQLDAVLACDPTTMIHVVLCNCRIKAQVVEQDPDERNLRRILNYGHTIGHAVEAASDYQLLHGEAVAIGLVAVGMIEQRLGLDHGDKLQRLIAMLQRLKMPTRIPEGIPHQKVMRLLAYDKKSVDSRPRFVLTSRLGQVYCPAGQWAVEVDLGLVDEIVKELC